MKWSVSAMRGACGLAAAVLALGSAACSDNGSGGPSPGVATVGFAPKPVNLPYLNLNRAKVQLDRLQLLGNVPPPPPPGSQPPPSGSHPPQDGGFRPPLVSVDLDALATSPSSATLADLRQGLYSRVRFTIGRIDIDGTARGTTFHVSLAPFGVVVDVLAPAPQELGLDQNIAFEVDVDPNFWFPPYMFDGAMLDSRGEIVADDVTNGQIASILIPSMASSFSLP